MSATYYLVKGDDYDDRKLYLYKLDLKPWGKGGSMKASGRIRVFGYSTILHDCDVARLSRTPQDALRRFQEKATRRVKAAKEQLLAREHEEAAALALTLDQLPERSAVE
jgi:hypothetical protein